MKTALFHYIDSLIVYLNSVTGILISFLFINLQVWLNLFKSYVFGDIEFLRWYSVLLVWDTIFGTWAALKTQLKAPTPFKPFRFIGVFLDKILTKIFVSGGVLSIGYVLTSHTVMGEKNVFYSVIITIFYGVIMGKEATSALGHIVSMGQDWSFVSDLIKKIKDIIPTIVKTPDNNAK